LATIQALVYGTAEDVVARLGEYVRAGARHLVVRIAAIGLDDQADQLERLAGVGPLVRGWAARASGPDVRP
jgi:hypothetical protein